MKIRTYGLFLFLLSVSCHTTNKIEDTTEQLNILNTRLADCDQHTNEMAEEIKDYQNKLSLSNQSLEKANQSTEQLAQRLDEMNRLLDDESVSLNDIRKKIFTGLHSIQDSGIMIRYLNGMIIVSMQDQLTFGSGSSKMKTNARQVLVVIARVLQEYPQVTAIIVGHTDSVKTIGRFTDNWSLSTERSNCLARILVNDLNADPMRIVVAGKSQYSPVASNLTAAGRQKNRRTDIIINPDLSRLWQLSQKYP